ncbi:MAG: hypothetical protein MUO26_12545 [Methanotrichaceae archaeon]|nr:hypothetical protein [Methanotrichaceae archaeon]
MAKKKPKYQELMLPDRPDRMSDADLKAALDRFDTDVDKMRSLILAEILDIIARGGQRDQRTLRGFWYASIKSALSRTGLLNKKTSKGNPIEWDAKLSAELEDMVSSKLTSYEELHIIDGSRQRSPAVSMTNTVAKTEWVGAHYPWVIIFTEKDTIWPVLKSVAELYGVSVISGGGEPAASCTEDILKQIVRSKAFKEQFPGTIYLLGLTDYDPYGYHIFNAQYEQIKRLFPMSEIDANKIKEIHFITNRIGVHPKHIPPEEIALKTYTPKPAGLEEWLKRTGGVYGKPLGIELDVLPVQQMRQLFAEAIEGLISLDERREDLRQAFLEELAWETLMPDIETKKDRLSEAVKSSQVWSTIQDTPLPNEIFRNAAMAGSNVVNPLNVFDCGDEVRAVMSHAQNRNMKQETRIDQISVYKITKRINKLDYEYWYTSWRTPSGSVHTVHLGSTKKMNKDEAMKKARQLKLAYLLEKLTSKLTQ